jgi:leucyl aminopeptidase
MGTDAGWTAEILAAGDRTNERVWELPLPSEYRSMLDSTVADVKNIGGAHAGALTAGLFLKEFVAEGIPWAHIDIAGPAFTETGWDEHPKGGTGYGVRLLIDLVERA